MAIIHVLIDYCPDVPSCEVRLRGSTAGEGVIESFRKCPYHAAKVVADATIYSDMIRIGREREKARAATHFSLRLAESVEIWYRIERNDGYTLGVDQEGNIMPEWPRDPVELELLRNDVNLVLTQEGRGRIAMIDPNAVVLAGEAKNG